MRGKFIDNKASISYLKISNIPVSSLLSIIFKHIGRALGLVLS